MTEVRLTPAELESRLRMSGRAVGSRTLRSWYSPEKGFLPPPQRHGRGRGAGAVWTWEDPEIFERACIVYDALEIKRRAYFAQWCLWWCGYRVDPTVIRHTWLKMLESEKIRRRTEPGELSADRYSHEIESLSTKLQKAHGIRSYAATGLALAVVLANQEPVGGNLNEDEGHDLLEGIFQFTKNWKMPAGTRFSIAQSDLDRFWPAFKAIISIDARVRLIKSASDEEFSQSQRFICVLGRFLKSTALVSNDGSLTPEYLLQLRIALAHTFGPPIFRIVLQLIRTGNHDRLAATEGVLQRLAATLTQGPKTKGSNRRPSGTQVTGEFSDAIQELLNIWNDLPVSSLYISG